MQAGERIPAAQYLRMSTEQQQYSFANQAEANQVYAHRNGFEIIKTYRDAGKSGVLLRKRSGLISLLQDVLSGTASFQAVLVYDVSRWGRFQDCDEAAHYEFVCKQAHIPVYYSAETFGNEGSLPNLVMKGLKRAMAAEFSRELGIKVFAAEKQWAELGFKQGGRAGYALRRLMVSCDGQPQQVLASGEVKCLQSNRVILVPGPPEEVECVREMYRLVVESRMTPVAVARKLNQSGITCHGRKWSHQKIYTILTHPKYAGYNVWNRVSRRLGGPCVKVPRSEWILKPGAFEPVVDGKLFEEAQHVLAQRTCCRSNEQLLQSLRDLLSVHGKLTSHILKKSQGAASPSVYVRRFGTLVRAFELAGYPRRTAPAIELGKKTRTLREDLVHKISSMFPNDTTVVRPRGKAANPYLVIDKRVNVSLFVCRSLRDRLGSSRIQDRGVAPVNALLLVARVGAGTDNLQDLYILPPIRSKSGMRLTDKTVSRGKRLCDLAQFCSLVRALAGDLASGYVGGS